MNKSTRNPTCHRGPYASKTKSTSTVKALPFFKISRQINRKTPRNLLMQNVSVQLYTISTTQKGQWLLICFESDLSALLHYKVDAACKLPWLFFFFTSRLAFKSTPVPLTLSFVFIQCGWHKRGRSTPGI